MSESRRANFASFYRATLMPLRRYLARMLGNSGDAEDLAHDAYVRIYESMDVESVDQPKAYLFITARRLALNQIKRRKIAPVDARDGAKIIEFAEAGAPGVERVVMARQEWARLEGAIEELPTGCRNVLLLRKRDQLSHANIGLQLGIAVIFNACDQHNVYGYDTPSATIVNGQLVVDKTPLKMFPILPSAGIVFER